MKPPSASGSLLFVLFVFEMLAALNVLPPFPPFLRQPSQREPQKMAPQIVISDYHVFLLWQRDFVRSGLQTPKISLEKPSSTSLSHPDILKTTGCSTLDAFWHPDWFVAIFFVCVI